ncbi:MAG TPA: hypothetical protein VF832_09030 [Longimicrobiales bacterium]
MASIQPDRKRRWTGALLFGIEWAVFLAAWLFYVWSLELAELVIGLLASGLAAGASHLVWAEHLAGLSFHPRWLAQAWRIPGQVLLDTGTILAVLARRLFTGRQAPSLFRAVPYEWRGADPHSSMLRALAITYATISPNMVVIGIDRERGYLLYHQLRQSPVSRMLQALGARP